MQNYKAFGQQFVFASSESGTLQQGPGCVGDATTDPLGASFDQVYNGAYNYLIWNDQFYDDPKINGCDQGMRVALGAFQGDAGVGRHRRGVRPTGLDAFMAGRRKPEAPRKTDGNTLGCVTDNDVEVSQHFFALKLTEADLVKVLNALQNASVVTDPKNLQIVKNGGPADVQKLVKSLGVKSKAKTAVQQELSTGVELISKPSALNVPPWQMVSSFLGGVALRAATWWAEPEIYSTTAGTTIGCWSNTLGKPGPVEIATTGRWAGQVIGLTGGDGPDFNHAKVGVSTSGAQHYVIFGDMNQQGTLSGPNCDSSQNGRGGLFYVLDNKALSDSVTSLISGDSAPTSPPGK